MSEQITEAGSFRHDPLGTLAIAITAASVEQTGLIPGAYYEMTACAGSAVCRWDTSAATVADGGATFVVPANTTRVVRNPAANTLLNVIEADASSDATALLIITLVFPE